MARYPGTMRLTKLSFRLLVLLTLMVHTVGRAAAAVVHLPREIAAFGHTDHVQSPGDNSCAAHSDEVCQICRMGGSAPSDYCHSNPLFFSLHVISSGSRAQQSDYLERDAAFPVSPRAPPQA